MNSLTIGQTKHQTELAVAVHQRAEIKSIRLSGAKICGIVPPDDQLQNVQLTMEVKSKRIKNPAESLRIGILFRLAGSTNAALASNKSRNGEIFSIDCTFEVEYSLEPGFKPTSDQIRAFKDGNAIFNCWPYCREYIQDSIVRMGYPPLAIPLLRVSTKPNTEQHPK
jgi:hypothetical protein